MSNRSNRPFEHFDRRQGSDSIVDYDDARVAGEYANRVPQRLDARVDPPITTASTVGPVQTMPSGRTSTTGRQMDGNELNRSIDETRAIDAQELFVSAEAFAATRGQNDTCDAFSMTTRLRRRPGQESQPTQICSHGIL